MRAASIRNAARMHGKVPGNPARGEAQGRIGVRPRWPHVGPQTGVEAQKSKSIIRAIAGSDHPDENKSGADDPAQTARGPGRTEMSLMHLAAVQCAASITRLWDQTCEGSENPRSAAGRVQREGPLVRQGRVRTRAAGSGTPR